MSRRRPLASAACAPTSPAGGAAVPTVRWPAREQAEAGRPQRSSHSCRHFWAPPVRQLRSSPARHCARSVAVSAEGLLAQPLPAQRMRPPAPGTLPKQWIATLLRARFGSRRSFAANLSRLDLPQLYSIEYVDKILTDPCGASALCAHTAAK